MRKKKEIQRSHAKYVVVHINLTEEIVCYRTRRPEIFREWWKEYEVYPEGCSEYILVDPASTQKKKSDFTVIECWDIDWEGKHYLKEGVRDKLEMFASRAALVIPRLVDDAIIPPRPP